MFCLFSRNRKKTTLHENWLIIVNSQNSLTREASLVAAAEKWKIAKNELHSALCEEQLKLLKYQKTLEEKFHHEFVTGSLQDTVVMLLSLGEVKLADKLRTEYKMPDRRYIITQLNNLLFCSQKNILCTLLNVNMDTNVKYIWGLDPCWVA